jgi:hypothetical protein
LAVVALASAGLTVVAQRYLAWSELGWAPTTNAYLAELERMLWLAPPEAGDNRLRGGGIVMRPPVGS